jgi:hypothetical protein
MVELNGPWRFHIGDQAAWAEPRFDDSAWGLLRADSGYSEQGYRGYSGFSWYRLRVDVPAWPGPLALYMPAVGDTYQVFANGKLIGKVGGMPPNPRLVIAGRVLFPIPVDAATPGNPLALAVRVWRSDRFAVYPGGGLNAPPLIGSLDTMTRWQSLETHEIYWKQSDSVMAFFANILTALAGLALFVLRPKEREYLWFGAAQVLWSVQAMIGVLLITRQIAYVTTAVIIVCSTAGAKLLNLEFFVTLMRQRKRILYWTAAASVVLSLLLFVSAVMGWVGFSQYSSTRTILELVYAICVPAMLLRGVRNGNLEAKLLIGPFTLSFLCNVILPLFTIPALLQRPWVQAFAGHFFRLFTWPFPISAPMLAGDLAMFSVMAVLVLRFARSRRDEERLVAELEAARAVQHVLIPDKIPSVPGFSIDCAYKPAGEVGGDFFQILPLPDGDALVVIGDVSGKGLPAAMTVSLLVGMVRMLALSTQSPAEILAAINQNMMGRTSGGFTTCLILHIKQNGAAIAANAGHVPPYLNGGELRVENGLPLGLDGSAIYRETTFQLAPEGQVTLLTDGVVEARTADGELFGFERVASISAQPAAEIAAAAQRFGQQDDITVLSLTREPSAKEAIKLSTWSAATA